VAAGHAEVGGIEIRDVRTHGDLGRFVAFPERLYARHPCYVPKLAGEELAALSASRNPAFEYCEARCWMAFRGGEPVGRIAGIINRRYIETWGLKRARFGWIDFVDDPAVARALLGTVEAWARARGLDAVHGPLGFCDLDREGMLVEGFDQLDLLITNYNYPYYPAHLESLGYRKDVDWVEFEVPVPATLPPEVDRVSRVVLGRSRLRLLETRSRRELLPHVPGVFALVNEAYAHLYGVVAISDRQVASYTKSFFGFINHEYVKVVLDAGGRVAAFGIAMPSLSRALQKCRGRLFPFGVLHLLMALRRNDRLDLLLIAVRPELQNKGIPAVLINEVWKACLKNGIRHAETGPELETNEKIQAMWTPFHPRQHRRRRCFVKTL
jgi:GNAT superfamily N-acetyltransferase